MAIRSVIESFVFAKSYLLQNSTIANVQRFINSEGSIFDYSKNTTICDDLTICPGPNNKTCCDSQGGKSEINFHNIATIPSAIISLSTYYSQGGYAFTCDEFISSLATTTPVSSPSSPSPTSISIANSLSTPIATTAATGGISGPSAGAKGGIATGVIVGVAIIASLGFLLYKQRQKTLEAIRSSRFNQPQIPSSFQKPQGRQNIELEPHDKQRVSGHQELDGVQRLFRFEELSGWKRAYFVLIRLEAYLSGLVLFIIVKSTNTKGVPFLALISR